MDTTRNSPDADSRNVLGLVPKAENLIVTSDNRWFASGGDGFYQIDPSGATQPWKIPIAFDANAVPSSEKEGFFCGITQYKRFIYANCTLDPGGEGSPRYIMCMDTAQSPLSMVAIHCLFNAVFFNGMASDADGNLYLAEGGKFFPPTPGKLVKLSLSSPTTVASQSDWLTGLDGRPNGIKIAGHTLYFSQNAVFLIGHSHVKKVEIKAEGTAGTPKTLYTSGIGKLLDDLELVDGGLLLTQAGLLDSLSPARFHRSRFNKVINIDEEGRELHDSHVPLTPPSAVRVMPGAGAAMSADLIVTERTGVVSRLSQRWGVRPRTTTTSVL